MSALGAIFLDNAGLKTVSGLIDGMDFYRESHRKIYLMMQGLAKVGQPIDFITACNELKSRGELGEVGGGAYLSTLVEYVPTSANVAYYCKIVKEMSVRRKMITYAHEISQAAYDGQSASEIIPEAKAGLIEISASLDSFGGVSLSDLSTIEQRTELYKKQVKHFDKTRFITEYHEIDRRIRGIAPGEVMTIVAEPGGFKTAFLQNLLKRGKARTKNESLFFSLEMPAEKVFEREIQIDNSCSGLDVEKHFKEHPQFGMNIVDPKLGMIVCAKPRLSLEKMERYIEMTRQKFGEIGVVGIDFIQLMAGPGKIFDRIEHNAYGIKQMAVALAVPVILLSQINVVGRKEKEGINFHDAKGGGSIEEAADFGLGFYHDKNGVLVCVSLKNRNGPKGWKLEADLNRAAFQFLDFTEYVETKSSGKGEEQVCPY